MTRLLGAILAGGESRRFGSDKAEAMLDGRPLIEHVIAALRPAVDELVICGRTRGDIRGVADRPAPGMGPLGGLNGALHDGSARGFDAVLAVGCDTPLLPPGLLGRLQASAGPAYVARLPVIGYWPTALAFRLDAFLAEDRKHAIRGWAEAVGAEAIQWPSLANVNEPADLVALSRKSPG